jgi:adenylate kinase family enzyme
VAGLVIFGNSSSGKSTLAQRLAGANALAHLDLDTLACSSPLTCRRAGRQ